MADSDLRVRGRIPMCQHDTGPSDVGTVTVRRVFVSRLCRFCGSRLFDAEVDGFAYAGLKHDHV